MPTPEEVLTIGFDLDITGALKDLASFQRKMASQMGAVTDTVDKLSKANEKMAAKATKGTKEWQDTVEDLEGSVDKLDKVMADLERKQAKASGAKKKALQDQIDMLKKVGEVQKKGGGKGEGGGKDKGSGGGGDDSVDVPGERKKARKISEALKTLRTREAKDMGDDMYEGVKGGLSGLFNKDLKGSIAGGGKILSSVLEGTFKLGGGFFKKGGELFGDQAGSYLARKSAKMSAKGGIGGKIGGGALKAGGGAMKGMGVLMKGMGGFMGILAKIGPLLGMMSSALMGIVGLFLGLDQKVKDFNNSILQAAGSSGFLAQQGGNADLAFTSLEHTMNQVRDAAMSWESLGKWGIDPEQHAAILNVLTQEGLEISDMGDLAKQSGKDIKQLQMELAKVSVGFSRLLGVPLQEINQLQVEMMTEMGASLDETKLSFGQMTRTASESGIAANKFFQMIKGVSQDLSLYNTRMGSAVKLLGELGKVMSPRSAQKFMQFATQGLKSMDQDARMRLDMLSGGKGKGIVMKDLDRKHKDLLTKMAGITGESETAIEAQLEGGAVSREKMFEKLRKSGDKQAGAMIEAAEEQAIDKSAAGKKQYGVAAAMGNLSAGASLDMMKAGMTKFSGAKSISEGIGTIGQDKMAQMLGISEEQVRGMAKLESHLIRQREVLKDTLKNGTKEEQAAAREQLKKANITEEQLNTNRVEFGDLMRTLTEEEKKAVKEETETQLEVAQQQKTLTESFIKKFERLMEFLMNQLYNIFVDIWDLLSSSKVFSDIFGEGPERQIKKDIMLSKDADLSAAWGAGKGNKDAFKGELMKVLGPLAENTIRGKGGTYAADDISAAAAVALSKLEGEERARRVKTAGEAANLSAEQIQKIVAGGGATTGAGLSQEQEAAYAGQISWQIDPAQMPKFFEAVKAAGGAAVKKEEERQEHEDKKLRLRRAADERYIKEHGALPEGRKLTPLPKARAEAKVKAKEEAKAAAPPAQQAATAKTAAPPGQPAAISAGAVVDATQAYAGQQAMAEAQGAPPKRPGAAGGTLEGKSKEMEATAKGQGQLHGDLERIEKRLGTRGIKFDNSFLTGPYGTEIEKRVLDALRVALVEFALYKDEGKAAISKLLEAGMDPKTLGKDMVQAAQKGTEVGVGFRAKKGDKAAQGGYIVGQNPDGTARILKPPAGESPAFVGAGEGVLSKGAMAALAGGGGGRGGGTNIQIAVNGVGGRDLARIIETKVADGIFEYKRREGFS